MATILKSYNWDKISRNTTGRSESYPWEDWFDGQIWKLRPDTIPGRGKPDFSVPAFALERVIRTAANRKDKYVQVRITEDGFVVLQARDQNGDAPAKASKPVAKGPKASTTKAPAKVSKPTTKTASKGTVADAKAAADSVRKAMATNAPSKRTVNKTAPAPEAPKAKRVLRRTAA